jgi:hypothetical protein
MYLLNLGSEFINFSAPFNSLTDSGKSPILFENHRFKTVSSVRGDSNNCPSPPLKSISKSKSLFPLNFSSLSANSI